MVRSTLVTSPDRTRLDGRVAVITGAVPPVDGGMLIA
jgi:hypothetical protein